MSDLIILDRNLAVEAVRVTETNTISSIQLMGSGGESQGILAAAALRGLGGQMQARLIARNDEDKKAINAFGIYDSTYKYSINEMASGKVTFAAKGVNYGAMHDGIKTKTNGIVSHSMVTRSQTGTLRYIKANHDFVRCGANE